MSEIMESAEGQSSGNQTEAQQHHEEFWSRQMETIQQLKPPDFKQAQELPLARIKKIMKLDEDVKMISAEAPVLFAKAAEIFITELSLRAWLHTEENKRRTLQRNDIAMAITKYDQFDFLIDIVPRDELKPPKRSDGQMQQTAIPADQVQYYFSVAQNQAQGGNLQVQGAQQTATAASTTQPQAVQAGQLITTQPQLQVQTGADGQASIINSQGQVVPIQLPAGTNLQQVVANASGDNQQVQLGNPIQYVTRQGTGNQQTLLQQQTTGQEFITQISGGQVYQIQQVATQAQAGNGLAPVFLQQALPDTAVSSTEQQ
ncbi:nuclear transcription factor Y subunit gamma-like [Diadema setosum]|uniref:nuclear transcription factor Y subunit gamma-like n=1 Tax=Diadema setosum TaxID=31175 RepID=UPI003B3B3858